MLITKELQRVFIYKHKGKEIALDDPSAGLSPDAVLNFYTGTYAELVSARVEGPEIKNDRVQYTFVSNIGTKG
jgi:PRTRC genetic system protein C